MAFSFSRILLSLGGYFSSSRWSNKHKKKRRKKMELFIFLFRDGFVTRQKDQEAKKKERKKKIKKKRGYLTVSGADRSCCVLLLWAVEEFLKSIFSSILSWERDRSRVSTNAFKSAILRRFVPAVVVLALELLFIIIPLWLLWPPMLQQLLLLLVISCSLRSVCSVGLDPASVTRRYVML